MQNTPKLLVFLIIAVISLCGLSIADFASAAYTSQYCTNNSNANIDYILVSSEYPSTSTPSKGSVFETKNVSVTINPGDVVYLAGYRVGSDSAVSHFTDDRVTITTSLGKREISYYDAGCTKITPISAPVNLTSLFLSGSETGSKTISASFSFRDICGAYIGHSNYYLSVIRCGTTSTPNHICSTNSDCGTNGYVGSAFCQNGDVYKSYRTYTCNNAGTSNSYCSNSTVNQLFDDCSSSETCSNGSCTQENIDCHSNSDCGTNGYTGSEFCWNGDVYRNYKTYTCHNAGTSNSYCSNTTERQLIDDCNSNETCNNGSCEDDCDTPAQTFSVQTTQATNIQNNQATLNGYLSSMGASNCTSYVWFQWGTTTAYGNTTNQQPAISVNAFTQNIIGVYSGNTYHFRAVARNCSGQTVYGQDQTFYVYPQVLGATTVSTGITNNFWMDSFILPLIVVLAFITMLKMGMFVSIEKWLASKKLVRRNIKAESELNKRIFNIKGF